MTGIEEAAVIQLGRPQVYVVLRSALLAANRLPVAGTALRRAELFLILSRQHGQSLIEV